MALNVVIMAAGKGTRMKSALPKVLHKLAGTQPIAACSGHRRAAGLRRTAAHRGHHRPWRRTGGGRSAPPAARSSCARCRSWAPATPCSRRCRRWTRDNAVTLILNGDVPLIRAETARALVQACGGTKLALLTIELPDATGYGRIVRDGAAQVRAIVEHKDASPAQRAIREVYTGMMAAPTALLTRWVMALKNDNVQREYYLTDIVAMAVAEGVPVVATAGRQRNRGAGRQQPRAAGRPGAALPARDGRGADGSRRAPGRPGAARRARRAGLRQRRRDRRQLHLRRPGGSWATACASAPTASSATPASAPAR